MTYDSDPSECRDSFTEGGEMIEVLGSTLLILCLLDQLDLIRHGLQQLHQLILQDQAKNCTDNFFFFFFTNILTTAAQKY